MDTVKFITRGIRIKCGTSIQPDGSRMLYMHSALIWHFVNRTDPQCPINSIIYYILGCNTGGRFGFLTEPYVLILKKVEVL